MDGKGTESCPPAPFEDTAAASEFGVRCCVTSAPVPLPPPPNSLPGLPHDVLRTVLHLAGRPVRGACRALRDGYGPLDGGLYLEHLTPGCGCHLCDLAATSSSRGGYHHIHTLVLRPHLPPAPPPDACAATSRSGYAALGPLLTTFPTLRTLHLDPPITLDRSVLHHLAPLAPHLHSLTVTFHDLPSLAALATTLTSLRELTLHEVSVTAPVTLSTLHPLAPTLLRLAYSSDGAMTSTAAQALRSLAPFTCLTHLTLPAAAMGSWDQDAVDLLATTLPRLQALKFGYFDTRFAGDGPLADAIWAALARRTALASLTTAYCSGFPSSPPPLHLAQLFLKASSSSPANDPVPLLAALAPSQTLTCLEVAGLVSLEPPVVDALCLFAGTLQCLAWKGHPASLSALLPLSQLTRLESLALRMAPGSDEDHPRGEQAVSAIAGGLPRLTSLQLQPQYASSPPHRHLAALLGAVAGRGALRHLALTCWDLQWGSSLLAPLATSLARLTLPSHPEDVLQVVESVSSLRALRCLRLDGQDRSATQAGGAPLPEPQDVDFLPQTAAAGRRQCAASERPAGQGPAAGQGEAGALRVQLPLGLRQLCLERMHIFRRASDGQWGLEAEVMAALLAAAARQDCVVWMDGAWPLLSSMRLPQHDDCHGYWDGASAEWMQAQRLQ